MRRVLFVHAGNMYGGVERVLETLAGENARAHGLDLRFAVCFEGRLSDTLRQRNVALDMLGPVRLTRPHLVLRARSRLSALLQRDQPAVVITTSAWAHAVFAPAVRAQRLPLASWVHDLLGGRSWLERVAGRWQPDFLICNSACTESAARSLYPSAPAAVIHGPIAFDDVTSRSGRIRRETRTGTEDVVVALVARMTRMKGQLALLDALSELPAEIPWRCWIVGAAQRPEEQVFERELTQRAGLRTTLLGARADVNEILADADLYCQPNEQPEAFGLSFVEALRAGLPVVTTNIGGAREIVTPECGRLVPANDRLALADALHELLTDADLRSALGSAGPSRARTLCDPATAYRRLLDTVVSAGRQQGAA